MTTNTQAARPPRDLAQFADLRPNEAGRILARLASTPSAPPSLAHRAAIAAAGLLSPRGFNGRAAALAELVAAEAIANAPRAWRLASLEGRA